MKSWWTMREWLRRGRRNGAGDCKRDEGGNGLE